MGLIRLIIIGVLIWLAWRLVKATLLSDQQNRQPPQQSPGSGRNGTPEKMVRCQECGIHVPESEAFFHKQLSFCSQEHQRTYLENHSH